MALTDSFVLPAGTVFQPVRELSEELRREMQAEDGDFAISRPNSRTHSKVVDADAAALIHQFETPSTIARAVARYSQGRAEPPESLLEDALPMLQSLIAARLLVAADSVETERIQPSLSPQDSVEGWSILRCVQTLEDTELFQTRGPAGQLAALKIGRAGGDSSVRRMLGREARILSGLDGTVTPALIRSADWNERPYLLIEWCPGVDANTVCDEFRRRPGPESRAELLRLTGAILDAYAHLHEQGVIHGDVHPRNVFVDRKQSVKIIDFGLSGREGDNAGEASAPRGGIGFFFEPEFARATRAGHWPPPSSMPGEQYAVAAMLYLLLTGSHYLDFSLEKHEMMRQIAEDPMTPFARRDAESWPAVERLLETALSKDPASRFPSMNEFAAAWHGIEIPPTSTVPAWSGDPKLEDMRARLLRRAGLGGELLAGTPLLAPTTSVNYGSAGIAYALYRMACAAGDAELFAVADLWSTRSVHEIADEGAFYNKELEIVPKSVGRNSVYHSPAGVYAVEALIAGARGDIGLQQMATRAFLDVSRQPCDHLDLALGRAGTLLACAFLLDATPSEAPPDRKMPEADGLRSFGHDTLENLWRSIGAFAPIRESKDLTNLGMAHGWAGLLYATLRWCASSGEPIPTALEERLKQLGECAEPAARGLQWRWDLAPRPDGVTGAYMQGWCNGSAGYVHLWTEAHRALGEEKYLELAEGAAWNVWETPSHIGNLCCGMAGQAYALLNLYRHTGDATWLRRARDAARYAGAAAAAESRAGSVQEQLALRPESLYKGDIGIVVLAADLNQPEHACMPLFETEI